jgi:hypothetical protein
MTSLANSNDRVTHQLYIIDSMTMLKPVIKPWLERGDDFTLEEDEDWGHGTGAIMRKWKETHHSKRYFQCAAASPDLASTGNHWQPTKQHVRKYRHRENVSLKELIREDWALVNQEFINEKVRPMPKRPKEVIRAEGAMTGY